MPFFYQSGEEVLAGDRIIYAESAGEVEYVVDVLTGDAARDWHFTHSPKGGFMIKTTAMGSVFLDDAKDEEDLDFVSRAPIAPA